MVVGSVAGIPVNADLPIVIGTFVPKRNEKLTTNFDSFPRFGLLLRRDRWGTEPQFSRLQARNATGYSRCL